MITILRLVYTIMEDQSGNYMKILFFAMIYVTFILQEIDSSKLNETAVLMITRKHIEETLLIP